MKETLMLVISSGLRQLMLCFVSLSSNLRSKKPFESCNRILSCSFSPFPGQKLAHYRLSKNICGMESESHFISQDAFLSLVLQKYLKCLEIYGMKLLLHLSLQAFIQCSCQHIYATCMSLFTYFLGYK